MAPQAGRVWIHLEAMYPPTPRRYLINLIIKAFKAGSDEVCYQIHRVHPPGWVHLCALCARVRRIIAAPPPTKQLILLSS